MELSTLLSALPLGDIGLSGIVVLTVLLILTGRIVPRSAVVVWQQAYFKEREAGEVKDRQLSELIEANRIAVRALDALPPAPTRGGEPNAATTATTADEAHPRA